MRFTLSAAGLASMKRLESLELRAYPDPASELGQACARARLHVRDYEKVPDWKRLDGSPWSIGWGHTGPEVVPGLVIDEMRADWFMAADVRRAERGVRLHCAGVELKQRQFDALVSLVYNAGGAAFAKSDMLKKLRAGDADGAATEFDDWVHANGKRVNGLVVRRSVEKQMFLGGARAKV
jgi:lysozyme